MEIKTRFVHHEMKGDGSKLYEGICRKLDRQAEHFGGRRWAVIADVDDTMFNWGQNGACTPSRLIDYASLRDIPVIYNTGRDLASVVELMRAGRIPVPDAVSTNICGPIYVLNTELGGGDYIAEDSFIEDEDFTRKLQSSIEHEDECKYLTQRIGEFKETHGFEMHVDGPMQQSPYSARMDYKLKPGVDRAKVVALRQALDDMGSHLTTVYYQDWKDPDRLTWSVIFVPWGKSGAIEHLQQKLALTGGVIAGDSGNDLDALMVESVGADFLRVLVGRLQYDADVDDLLAELNVNDTEGRTLFRGCKDSDRVFYVEGKESLRYGPDSIFRAMRMAGFRWQIQQMI